MSKKINEKIFINGIFFKAYLRETAYKYVCFIVPYIWKNVYKNLRYCKTKQISIFFEFFWKNPLTKEEVSSIICESPKKRADRNRIQKACRRKKKKLKKIFKKGLTMKKVCGIIFKLSLRERLRGHWKLNNKRDCTKHCEVRNTRSRRLRVIYTQQSKRS